MNAIACGMRLERALFLTFGLLGVVLVAPIVALCDVRLGWLIFAASAVLLGLGLFIDA